jgi:hypothetical protein
MVLGLQAPPKGPATASRLRFFAICFGETPAVKSSMIVQPCRAANSPETRSWSAIDAPRWLSDEYRA